MLAIAARLGRRAQTALAMLAALAIGFASAALAADPVTEQVVVAGAVKTALTLKVEDLKAFDPARIGTVSLMRRVGDQEVASRLRGVRLAAVIERAGLADTDPHTWKRTVVLATATDGYRVVLSWPEIVNSEAGNDMLVVFERDGQPLADREGRIALVSARDLRTGPRSVRWLARLDVRVIGE